MRKKLGLVLLCLVTMFLTSCNIFGGGNNQPNQLVKAPPDKQIYVDPEVGISDITTFDPALAFDLPSITAIQMVYTGLVQLDDKMQVQPQIAQSWTLSPDNLTWTFHLRSGLKFSDGTPLTSHDVAYSIDRALQPTTRSTVAPIYLALLKDSDKLLAGTIPTLIGDSLLTPDNSTLEIITNKQAPYFLDMLTHPCTYVVEKKLIDTYGANFTNHLDEGGGAGPFKVSKYIHGQEIDFVPNSNYYGHAPQLRKVIFPFYSQPGTAYQAYQANQVDTASIPLSAFVTDKKRSDFHQAPQLWINYYTMNYLVKPFDNIHIRQAFALAINKTAIANNVWKGTVLPTDHIVPQGMNGYNPHLTGPDGTQNLQGNPVKARALLNQGIQEEGWSSVAQLPPIMLTYATGNSTSDQEVAAMISMWQNVLSVRATADPVDYNTLLAEVTAATNNAHGLQFWGLSWVAEYPDPQDWLTHQFDRGALNNSMNYGENTSNDAAEQQLIQQQLENADADFHSDTRLQAYQQAEQQLVNDVAWLPMEQVTETYLRKPYVIGIANNELGLIPPNDWANVYIVQH